MTRTRRRWPLPLRVVTWPLDRLGMTWVRRDPRAAATYHDLEVARNSRLLGPYHRETLRARTDHAIALSKLGELQQAEAELTDVIIWRGQQASADDQLLLDVRQWHHHVLVQLGWVAETEADARFLAESSARRLGPDHPHTLHWRDLRATALWEAGRRDEAVAEITDVAARWAAALSSDHPDARKAERTRAAMAAGDDARFGLRPKDAGGAG